MEKINTDCKWRNWKILAKVFKMHKPWRNSFKPGYYSDIPVSCSLRSRRSNRARVIQTGAREGSQSREEKVERALFHACLLSRARLTRVLSNRAGVTQTSARQRSQPREEKVERALSRARLTRVLLNRARVTQTGARQRSQPREEKVERALSRARLTRFVAELLLRRLRFLVNIIVLSRWKGE